MPQVDLETLVSVCGGSSHDRKIGCEPLADDVPDNFKVPNPDVPPDFPPESFWLSKDAEFDWFNRNAFLERKESTKGNANSTYLNHSNSNSQRFSLNLKSKAAIIGLPKTQKTNYADTKRRSCKPPHTRLFPPKRSDSVGKSTAPMTEPSSPKVSCMGRVRSKRGCRRSSKTEKEIAKPTKRTRSAGGGKKGGFYSGLISLFRSDRRRDKPAVKTVEPSVKASQRKSTTTKKRAIPVSDEEAAEPPGLGGMTRFASGRRSESWSAEEIYVARLDSKDSEWRVATATSGSIRRS